MAPAQDLTLPEVDAGRLIGVGRHRPWGVWEAMLFVIALAADVVQVPIHARLEKCSTLFVSSPRQAHTLRTYKALHAEACLCL